jgi:dihydrofolate synthase / folylpolyglutamate synthase
MPTFDTLPNWLAHLETAHPVGIDMGLARISRVRDALGLEFKSVVFTVGGTNGKGSTCAMLEAILLAAGYKVGCHTSPHLIDFNERARVNGEIATDAMLLPHFEAVERARCSFPEPVSLTYFEFTTLAIMHLFANAGLDAVILEVGLGGRLDAVNIVDTDCAIITSVDLDHMAYLGDTREAIGFEKAGIFRAGKPAICSDPVPPISLVKHAEAIGADLWLIGRDFNFQGDKQQWGFSGRGRSARDLRQWLQRANQLLNASAALAALESVRDRLPISAQDVRLGLSQVVLPGRFQVLPGRPSVILDVAHNPHASAALGQNLENMGFYRYTYAVFGAMQDKDIAGVLAHMLDKVDHWCLTDLPTPRAASASSLAQALTEAGFRAGKESSMSTFSDPATAYRNAMERATEDDRIVVFGSFYTVAGVLAERKSRAH